MLFGILKMQCALCSFNNSIMLPCCCGSVDYCDKCVNSNKCYNCGLDIINIHILDYVNKLTNFKNNLVNENNESVRFNEELGLNNVGGNNNLVLRYNNYVSLVKRGKRNFIDM